jgi:hypothetical protein
MRAQAEQNRKREGELLADAQQFMAEAQAKYDQIVTQAAAQRDEAAYWEGLAEREEQAAAMPAGVTRTDGEVAGNA